MKVSEMKALIEQHLEKLQDDYEIVGLRFENKEREAGEECEYSKNNIDREDEREFPAYGTEEYEEMEEMDGTSSWSLKESWLYRNLDKDCRDAFIGKHAYLIVGNELGDEQLNGLIDDGELLIKDAVVAVKLY